MSMTLIAPDAERSIVYRPLIGFVLATSTLEKMTTKVGTSLQNVDPELGAFLPIVYYNSLQHSIFFSQFFFSIFFSAKCLWSHSLTLVRWLTTCGFGLDSVESGHV